MKWTYSTLVCVYKTEMLCTSWGVAVQWGWGPQTETERKWVISWKWDAASGLQTCKLSLLCDLRLGLHCTPKFNNSCLTPLLIISVSCRQQRTTETSDSCPLMVNLMDWMLHKRSCSNESDFFKFIPTSLWSESAAVRILHIWKLPPLFTSVITPCGGFCALLTLWSVG